MNIQRTAPVWIPVSGIDLALPGDLTCSGADTGLVIFAHGSGSSRMSPRNRAVATALAQASLATLLFDLLTEPEATDRANVFDIPLLAARVMDAVDWVRAEPRLAGLGIGLFGASTGAAAALVAAADRREDVGAVVSRGGRPDLADNALERVAAPTLLIVGGADDGANDQINRRRKCGRFNRLRYCNSHRRRKVGSSNLRNNQLALPRQGPP